MIMTTTDPKVLLKHSKNPLNVDKQILIWVQLLFLLFLNVPRDIDSNVPLSLGILLLCNQ